MSITLLSLDPSSSACGCCYWPSIEGRNPEPSFLHVIRPGKLPSGDRISFIVEGVLTLARRFLPSHVVLEFSAGHQAGNKPGRMRGLATLGQAQGRVLQALLDAQRHRTSRFDPDEIVPVSEEWTGATPKDERALIVAAVCPLYRDFLAAGKDGSWRGQGEWGGKGLDAADSVGLGWVWIARHKIEAMASGAKRE